MRLLCPAKINLHLEVGRRRDDGYHELITLYQSVELADELVVEESAEDSLLVDGPFGEGVPCDGGNLVTLATRRFAERLQSPLPSFSIRLTKNVPPGAGLGGGSSNAAAMLRFLRQVYAPAMTAEEVLCLASQLGSDVPFLVRGGTAVGTGRGERLEWIDPLPKLGVLIAVPPDRLSTADVYRGLDESGGNRKPLTPSDALSRLHATIHTLRSRRSRTLRNDLGRTAEDLAPAVRIVLQKLEKLGALGACVSGSGSASYAIFTGPSLAGEAQRSFGNGGMDVFATAFMRSLPWS